MDQVKVTPEMLEKYDWAFRFGHKRLLLNDYVFDLDLDYCSVLIKKPIRALNFIAVHCNYISDMKKYGIGEHWPSTQEEVHRILLNERCDDCDGLTVAGNSILHSQGNQDARLAIGYYGIEYEGKINHAFGILWNDGDPYLLEYTAKEERANLRKLAFAHEYVLLMSADKEGIYLHGDYIEKYSV